MPGPDEKVTSKNITSNEKSSDSVSHQRVSGFPERGVDLWEGSSHSCGGPRIMKLRTC